MAIAQKVLNYLEEKSVAYALVAHPYSGSSHETAETAHISEDHIAKAVIVKDAAGYVMVVIPASQWVEMKQVRKELDRDLELVGESELAKLFPDCEVGALPPLGPAYNIEAMLDESLTMLANVYFESGDHEHLMHIRGDDFLRLLGGVRHGHFCSAD